MASIPAERFVCPRCQTAFDDPSRYCRQCGADMTGASAVPLAPPPLDAELSLDRRITDSNQAWLGKIVEGRYRVIDLIGRGGMGVVYRVEHVRMGKIAAMKVLHRDLAHDPEVVQRFEREAAAISRLNHPHAVQVFDFGNAQGNLYLVMELVRGLDLARVISRDGPLTWARTAPLLIQILGALTEAHELGIVHRDLKPENVLITRTTRGRDYAKVLDFGLAKLETRGAPPATTDKQSIVGTPYVMAPEQIRGDAVDARTDIYALGCLMFEVLTGEHLYTSTTAVGVLTRHLTGEPDAPSMRAPRMGIPPAVDHLCRKALARAPADRWQTAAELAEAIEEVYAETVTETTGAGGRPRVASRPLAGGQRLTESVAESDLRLRRSDIDAYELGLRRRRVIVGAGAAVIALGLVGGGVYVATRKPGPVTREREPNAERATANRIAPATPVTGLLGQRTSPTEGDRDAFVVAWPPSTRRVITVRVTAPPNIDLQVSIRDEVREELVDQAGVAEAESAHRRTVTGPVVITLGQPLARPPARPMENVSDPYTLTVTEDAPGGEQEPNGSDVDATPLALGTELRGYLDVRDDVDLLRWTGDPGAYDVTVRADGLPLAWRPGDGKPRSPGAARVELTRGEVLRIERTDRTGTGTLPGRDATWSIVVSR